MISPPICTAIMGMLRIRPIVKPMITSVTSTGAARQIEPQGHVRVEVDRGIDDRGQGDGEDDLDLRGTVSPASPKGATQMPIMRNIAARNTGACARMGSMESIAGGRGYDG